MQVSAGLRVLCAAWLLASPTFAAEIVRLSPATWDEYAPLGKEVDAIYGDYVVRNDEIVAVIAEPLPTRNANMTVRTVGGMLIDLTRRSAPNDQLSCYYANGMPMQFTAPDRVRVAADDAEVSTASDLKVQGKRVTWSVTGTSASGLEITVRYTLEDGRPWLLAETVLNNPKTDAVTQELSDLIRADRTFEFGNDDSVGLFWANDEWFRQGYGIVVEGRTLKRSGQRNQVLQMLDENDKSAVTIASGASHTISRQIFPASSLVEVRAIANQLAGVSQSAVSVAVTDPSGPVPNAKVTVMDADRPYGTARTNEQGHVTLVLPHKDLALVAEAIGRGVAEPVAFKVGMEPSQITLQLPACGYVVGRITGPDGGKTPCKIAFEGQSGTPTPDFGPDSGDTAVKNLYYSHDGRFRQEIAPGNYGVIISYGPEHDAIFTEITVAAGKETQLAAQLKRVVDTRGWVSTDFHSHSTPSGDNTSSQLGRVQNLLCEHVEYAPCTEHNRVDSYVPLLKQLGVEHLMGTCTGMELTGSLLPVNHQNAFPLIHKPRTQDGGGPRTDENPVVQIERLAMWDGGSDKLVQQNHPNLVQLFADKDEDGKFDGGFAQMLNFMDVMEVHPPQGIFSPPVKGPDGKLTRNPIFHWMQLLNLGYRIPGVVNTDAHYTYHDSGWLRNFVRSAQEDAAKIDALDMVRECEAGHIVMSTGPFMTVELRAKQSSAKQAGIPGDDVIAPGGAAELKVQVQCPNWLDINRVQVFFNGRPVRELNFTRRENPERFQAEVVKFAATLPLQLKTDTHVIVAAIGEGMQLGRVMGETRGQIPPVAVSNPIFVDVDGGGFKPSGDLLDLPFPR